MGEAEMENGGAGDLASRITACVSLAPGNPGASRRLPIVWERVRLLPWGPWAWQSLPPLTAFPSCNRFTGVRGVCCHSCLCCFVFHEGFYTEETNYTLT